MNKFPLEVFPMWFSEMVEAVSNKVQTPEVLAANFGISIISALVSLRVYVYCDENTQPTNLWTMTLLPAGEGKSPVLKEMALPLDNTNIAAHKVEDITVSAMCRKMKSLQKLFILSAEGTFFDNFLRDKGQSSTILMKSYDEESFSYQRGNNVDIEIEKPSLTLGLAIQNDRFKQYQSERVFQKAVATGLLDRFLPAIPESKVGRRKYSSDTRDNISQEIWETYESCIRTIMAKYAWTAPETNDKDNLQDGRNNGFETRTVSSIASENENATSNNRQNTQIILCVDNDAKKTFCNWRNCLESDFNEPKYASIHQWMGKMNSFVLRIAGILHIMEDVIPYRESIFYDDNPLLYDNFAISERQMERAISLVEYYRNERLKLTGKEYLSAEKILDYMKRNKKREIKRGRLRNALKGTVGLKSNEEFEMALAYLEEEGIINVTGSNVKIVE